MRFYSSCLASIIIACLAPASAHAIRPFVTDDARVVGHKLAQLETWVLADQRVFEHYALAAIGPTPWLEVTAGVLQGAVHEGAGRGYSITGPILQAKGLVMPAVHNGAPGVALAAGVLPSLGHGGFRPPGVGGFGYLALTESINHEAWLIHANLGFAALDHAGGDSTLTAGIGTQARVWGGLHLLGEAYYGDPYDAAFQRFAGQLGVRYIFSEHVQVDGTAGSTLDSPRAGSGHAQNEWWGTLGLRLVSSEIW